MSSLVSEQAVITRLAELLGVRAADVHVEARNLGDEDVDLRARVGARHFVIEVKRSGTASAAVGAIRTLRGNMPVLGSVLPLFVAPYLQPSARAACEEAGVSWFDLSGNATIVGPGLRIQILGYKNRFVSRGRPASVFAPKSSRVVRALFVDGPMRQRDLVVRTRLDDGYVSRTLKRLREAGFVTGATGGVLSLADQRLVLDEWRDAYDFSKHQVVRFNVAARSGEEVLHRLSRSLAEAELDYAATGLGAAWLWTRFAGFRTVSFFLRHLPGSSLLESLGLYASPKDGAVWLVVPNDDAVFDGAALRDGVSCVHPLQTWLDLKSHGERANEAAETLRPLILKGDLA